MIAMGRRGFLGVFAALALDPERLLWVPGQRLISIPAARVSKSFYWFIGNEMLANLGTEGMHSLARIARTDPNTGMLYVDVSSRAFKAAMAQLWLHENFAPRAFDDAVRRTNQWLSN